MSKLPEGKFVLTIGREYGSAGREIGRALADRLGVKCYDKELLSYAAKNSGISEELFHDHDEKPTNSFLYSLVMDSYSVGYSTASYVDMPINQKVFMAQYEAIQKLAEEENCIIVGRCADYALKDNPNLISVFIKANLEDKTKRIMRLYDYAEPKARDLCIKTDKKRASYYNFYTNKKWGDAKSYDLCIDSGLMGVDRMVDMLEDYIALRMTAKDNKKNI